VVVNDSQEQPKISSDAIAELGVLRRIKYVSRRKL